MGKIKWESVSMKVDKYHKISAFLFIFVHQESISVKLGAFEYLSSSTVT